MRRSKVMIGLLLVALTAVLQAACGSGYEIEKETKQETEGETIGTLSGVIDYEGEATGPRLVVGLMLEWPMTGPPARYWDVPNFTGEFPIAFEFELDEYVEGKTYYLAAFLDVDPDDVSIMMNPDVDPLAIPTSSDDTVTIEAGVNVKDFILLDPEDIDWWWLEEK